MAAEEDLPAVTVIIAFYKPDLALVRRQVSSLLAQQGVRLSGVAVMDGARTANNADLQDIVEQAGFDVIVNPQPLGIRGAFCEGLRHALENGSKNRYFCYSDQDDEWYPSKLSRVIAHARATRAALAHCDARVIAEDGSVVTTSLHRFESRRQPRDLFGMLLLNTVTGMTAVFTEPTARLAQKIMADYEGSFLHDHLTAIAAASLGRVAYLDEVLVDYVQHSANHLGARAHRTMIRRRAVGRGPLALYRATSDEMFRDRRAAAVLLDRAGVLSPGLRVLFLTRPVRGFWRLSWTYTRLLWGLYRRLDWRRWILGLRMMDAALFVHYPVPKS